MNFENYFREIGRKVVHKAVNGEYDKGLDMFSYSAKGIDNHKNLYMSIPNFKTQEDLWEFLLTHLPDGYKVGTFNISPEDIYSVFSPIDLVHQAIEFLELYKEGHDWASLISDLEFKNGKTLLLPIYTHYFKLSQLSRIYVKDGLNFIYPPTANKILNLPKYFLHPGGFRQLIYQVFSPDKDIQVLGLAAEDVEVVKEFDSNESILEYFNLNPKTAELDVTLHGFENLLLPQFAFGYTDYHKGLKSEFINFLKFFDSVNIFSNFMFTHKSLDQSKVKTEYYIELEDKEDPIPILKVLLLLPFLETKDRHYFEEIPGVTVRELKPIKLTKTNN